MWKKLVLISIVGAAVAGCGPIMGGGGTSTTGGTTVIALTAAECKQLGGTVSTDTVCGGQNKKCTTVTVNPVTGNQEAHSLCINE
jgi:hypothetical protein